MGFIRALVAFSLTIAILVFAVSNRQMIDVFWSPLHSAIQIPLYLVGLGLMATGFVFGAFLVWANESPIRRDRRKKNRQVKTLERKLEDIAKQEEIKAPPADFFPALPQKQK